VVQTKGHPSNIRNLSKGNKNELIVFVEIHCETQLRRKSSKVRIKRIDKSFCLASVASKSSTAQDQIILHKPG